MLDKRLMREGKHVKRYLSGTIALGVGIAVLAIIQAWLLSQVIAQVFLEDAPLGQVEGYLLAILGVIGVRGIFQYCSEVTAREAAIRVKERVRVQFLHKILALGPVYARGERGGELLNTAVEGIEALDDYFARYVPQLILAVLVPVLTFAFLLPKDFQSALVLIITGPLIPFFMILIGKLAEKKSLRQWQSLSRMSAHFLDMLQGLTTLKLFGRSKDQATVIGRVSEAFRKNTMSVMKVAFLSAFVLEFMGMISTAVIAVTLGLRLINGTVPYAEALFILILAPEFYLPLRTLGLSFHARLSGSNAAQRIFEVLEIENQLESELNAAGLGREAKEPGHLFRGDRGAPWLAFKQVDLCYEQEGERVLKDINFTLRLGERVALIGPSGAGKSSILQILLRFVEPTQGKILINDTVLTRIPPATWREMISYVPQKTYLFAGSIMENIRFGNPEAALADVVKAAQLAMAHEFITELPQGYDTLVGEGGARLSGGQAQRIAISRAFLKDAPLLLLDEVTSGLDNENEKDLLIALEGLCQGRTVIFTTHRMRTTIQADRILVLDKGRIIEEGSPRTLLNNQGLYTHFVSTYGRDEE
ncbi:thiol reductant ABC exporter subunit CydD [Desulfitobacterium chlororespirans]|uniref:ATP-binding cassette, subfamily C, CydD n=1 Tax=Desulfitobacterium chlororespirans DSM 11544 TaxID=1121395 RepID=A0A1M7T382_9FIRM|nr:thiol reductant ABC exporter subunit CydD [Desulfitobacterium chlororespirans]SHN65161.1 ATP-binding cassette, subfamily C, CydD [Desulfitobacterium chlororespirans DSM 11544]